MLERGGRVLLLDKNAFCGGNSVKATSGINGAGTSTQFSAKDNQDNAEVFYKDIWMSAAGLDKTNAKPYPLAKTLAYESGPAVTWLQEKFKLDLSLVSRLGGHSFPRTHRGKEKFPGMTITMALLEALEEVEKAHPEKCKIVNEATATKLLKDASGTVVGVEYTKGGKTLQAHGAVIIATGGYAADYTDTSLLAKYRPDLVSFPTTNGQHCTGDGIKMAIAIGAGVVDMEWVQVHPTGLVHPDDRDAKVKWLAAEALRGVGGVMIDRHGKRFVNELGTRDYVSTEMLKQKEAKGPYRLLINGKGSKEIEWHCHHYASRKLMKHYKTGADLAKDMGVPVAVLKETMDTYSKNGAAGQDPLGKKYFDNLPFFVEDSFYVAEVCPVVHYSMGGLAVNSKGECLDTNGKPIAGLFVTGEAMGGVHGKNRMGGNSLLDCVVFGRLTGQEACAFLLNNASSGAAPAASAAGRIDTLLRHLTVNVDPNTKVVSISIPLDGGASAGAAVSAAAPAAVAAVPAVAAAPAAPAPAAAKKSITMDEVAKHTTEKDIWVVVNGEVLDVTSFLDKHPGGKQVLMIWGGKDASTEYNMFHKKDTIAKYAPELVLGPLA